MAHTTTLRAQGATRASDARLSSPASSCASMYFISPFFPSAIHGGKRGNSPKSRTGAMPQRSNRAARAHRLMRGGRAGSKWAVTRGQFGGWGEVLDPVPAVLFGLIKAGISLIQQHFNFVLPLASRDGDSHTHGDESFLAGTNHRCFGNDLAQSIGAQQSVGQIAAGQNHKEFFSAIAANAVV